MSVFVTNQELCECLTYQRASKGVPCDSNGSQDPQCTLHFEFVSNGYGSLVDLSSIPFWRSALFLDLSKDTLGLVVNAVRTRRHLAVTLDFLLATHIACL